VTINSGTSTIGGVKLADRLSFFFLFLVADGKEIFLPSDWVENFLLICLKNLAVRVADRLAVGLFFFLKKFISHHDMKKISHLPSELPAHLPG
jgi:hypothetical protein